MKTRLTRIDKGQADRLQELKKKKGMAIQFMVQLAIEEYLKKEGK